MRSSAGEGKSDRNGSQGKDTGLSPQDELVEHARYNEEQRVQQFRRRIEFHALFEREDRRYRLEQMRPFSACQLTKAFAHLADTGYEFLFRQPRQHSQRMNPPQRKCLRLSFSEVKNMQWQRRQRTRFLSWCNYSDRDAGRYTPGKTDSRVKIAAHRDARRDA